MPVNINGAPIPPKPAPSEKRSTYTDPQTPPFALSEEGRLRVKNVLAVLGVLHSRFYELRHHPSPVLRFPEEDGREGNNPYWTTETVRKYLARGPRRRWRPERRPVAQTLTLPDGSVESLAGDLPTDEQFIGIPGGVAGLKKFFAQKLPVDSGQEAAAG
jgi:hypothetical protein